MAQIWRQTVERPDDMQPVALLEHGGQEVRAPQRVHVGHDVKDAQVG